MNSMIYMQEADMSDFFKNLVPLMLSFIHQALLTVKIPCSKMQPSLIKLLQN